MALSTVQAGVCTGQRESRDGMIEGSRFPTAGRMAGGTVRTEPAIVIVILPVAGIAVGASTLKDIVDMTVLTGDGVVFAGQFESEQIVIDSGWQPASGSVTGCAVCSELAVVFIIILMAGIAIAGCALEDIIDMALIAGEIGVLTIQFEDRQIMVEGGRCPASGGVTYAAIDAKTALVVVVLGMTREAILWRRPEVC